MVNLLRTRSTSLQGGTLSVVQFGKASVDQAPHCHERQNPANRDVTVCDENRIVNPADAKKCGRNTSGARARPLLHAAAKEMLTRSRPASPCSRRSATTRSARA